MHIELKMTNKSTQIVYILPDVTIIQVYGSKEQSADPNKACENNIKNNTACLPWRRIPVQIDSHLQYHNISSQATQACYSLPWPNQRLIERIMKQKTFLQYTKPYQSGVMKIYRSFMMDCKKKIVFIVKYLQGQNKQTNNKHTKHIQCQNSAGHKH